MQKRRGFTTVELVIVIAVIAILATALIPTFGGLIKSANHNVDVQTANSMTKLVMMYAVNNKIESESDLRDAINLEMGEGYYETLSPKSGRYGYHFWYDIENNQFIVKTVEEIDALYQERTSQTHYIPEDVVMADGPVVRASLTSWKESEKHFRSYKGFFLADRGGSLLGESLAKLDKAGVTGYSFGDVLTTLTSISNGTGEDKAFATEAAKKLEKIAVVAAGTHVKAADAVIEYVYFSLTIEEISATTTVINNNTALSLTIPSNIKKINSYGLEFKTESNLILDATEDNLGDILGAYCVENCTITIAGVPGYTVFGSTVFNSEDKSVATLAVSASSVVTDMALSGEAIVQNKIEELVPNADGSYNLFVAVDYNNTITFSVADYFGTKVLEDGTKEKITAKGTIWAVGKDSKITCTSAKNGTFTVDGYNVVTTGEGDSKRTDYIAGTITATIQDVTKTIHVYIVKALGITVDTSNNQSLNIRDVDQNNVTITLPYTPDSDTNKWNFKPSMVMSYTGTSIKLDNSIIVKDSADALSFASDVLGLKPGYSNTIVTKVTLSVDDDNDATTDAITSNVIYTVKLINQGEKIFEEDAHIKTYTKLPKFYVGNAGKIKLDYLFDVIDGKNIEGQKLFVKISSAGSVITPVELEFDSLDDELPELKFTVNNEYTIEICVGQEILDDNDTPEDTSDDVYVVEAAGAPTSITVKLVDATNVSGNITTFPSTNIVLLADTTLAASGSHNITNFYGNLHKLECNTTTEAPEFWASVIRLSGTMQDAVVIGPVYESLGFNDPTGISINKEFGWDGIKLTGNAQINNSYLFGFRAPMSINDAVNPKVSNSVIEGGTYANIHVANAKVTLENVRLVQDIAGYQSTTNKNTSVYGMGIFCDTASYCNIVLTGDTRQYNWTSVEDADKINTSNGLEGVGRISVSEIISNMINDGVGFVHTAVDADGNTVKNDNGTVRKYINVGIIQELSISNAGCDSEVITHQIDLNDDENSLKYDKGNRINYNVIITTKYYEGYSYAATGNKTVSTSDFLPKDWTSQRNENYKNFLKEKE